MNEENDFEKRVRYQNEFDHNKSLFESNSSSPSCHNFIPDSISPDINDTINDLQMETNKLKQCSTDFSKSISPIFQVKNACLINRRLQIAINIRNIYYLSQNFDTVYNGNASDRSILDIMQLFKIYSKFNADISEYVKIQACDKLKKEIEQKICNIGKMIAETIKIRSLEKLTSSELFQLMIISSSFDQFWNYFGLNDSLFTTKDYKKLIINIEKMFLFFGKIEKLANLLNQSNLNEYLISLQDKKEHFTSIIFKNIRTLYSNSNDIPNFQTFTNNIFENLDLLKMVEQKETIPISFKESLNKEISKIAIYVYDLFVVMKNSQFPDIINDTRTNGNLFLRFVTNFNNSLKLYIDPSHYDQLNNTEKTERLIALYQGFVYLKFKQGFLAFPDIIDETFALSYAAKQNNEDFIPAFKPAFYNIAKFELNSMIASLLNILKMDSLFRNFKKSPGFKDRYDIICKKIDKNIKNSDEIMSGLIPKLNEIIAIRNVKTELYKEQTSYVTSITENYLLNFH